MIRKRSVLTEGERSVLILGGIHPLYSDGKQLTNAEIGQRLGFSVSKVKSLIHQACAKLNAHGRNEAILFALRKGQIRFDEIFTLDEIAEFLFSLDSDVLKRIAQLMRQGVNYKNLSEEDASIINANNERNTILTKAERDVVILVGCGFRNKQIADNLYISTHAVSTYLYRASRKLGARRRADLAALAVKQRELNMLDAFSPSELIRILAPLGADYIDQVAQKLDKEALSR